MKSRIKSTKPINPNSRRIVVTFKINEEELKSIEFLAHSFTNGNMSDWIRYAALHFKPLKEDFEKVS